MNRKPCIYKFVCAVIAAVLLFVNVPRSGAQTVSGSLVGTVKDSQGAAIANASVTAKSEETGSERSVMTDGTGGYNIVSVPAGAYEITVTSPGFEAEIQKGITMTVGAVVRVDFSMKVGSVSQQVEVTGEAPQVNTSNATVGGLVDDTSMRELPLNARDWLQLSLTQSNVVDLGLGQNGGGSGGGAQGAGVKLFVAGSRATQNAFRIDGLVVNDYGNNSPGNALGYNPGVDSVREFTVLANGFSAEYGRSSGGVINSILKSGTNSIHGTAFYFLRNSVLDAKNFFNSPTLPIPQFRRNQFGASIGGPIKKDKLFFFANYEGIREFLPENSSSNTISNTARMGLICVSSGSNPCASQTQVAVAPTIALYLPAFPVPNTPTSLPAGQVGSDAGVFDAPGGSSAYDNYVIGKVDYQMNASNLFSVSYNYDFAQTDPPDIYADKDTLTQSRTQRAIFTFQHVFSPTVLNTARAGINRLHAPVGEFNNPVNSTISNPAIGWIPGKSMGVLEDSAINTTGAGGLSIASDVFDYTSPQASDDLSWVKGRNNFRFGGSFEDINTNLNESNYPAGEFVFSSTLDMIEGIDPSQTNIDIPGSNPARSYRAKIMGAYIVDDLRVLPNLTLNLGLRYEPDTIDKEAYNKASVIINFATDTPGNGSTIPPSPYRGNPLYQNNSFKNFAPRIGLAWDPFKDGKSSVRAFYGIYDILLTPNLFSLRLDRSFPFYNESVVTNPCNTTTYATSCFPNGLLNSLSPNQELTMYIQNKPPATYKQQWNLSVQRQITPTLTLSLAYVGSRGTHLPVSENDADDVPLQYVNYVNGHYTFPWEPTCAVSAPACGTAKASYQPVPGIVNGVQITKTNPNWSRIQSMGFYGYAIYNSGQVTATKQMGHGLSFNASYTYARSMDNGGQEYTSNEFASSISNPYPYITALQRAPSDFDVRHQVTLNYIYDIPAPHFDFAPAKFITSGWELTGIFTARTGLPFSIGIPNDQAATGGFLSSSTHVAQRPDFNPSAPGCNASTPEGAVTGNINAWLNMACFPYPAAGTLGDLGRNQLRGPGSEDFDFSLFKNDKAFHEKLNVQFRAEFFNVLNHPNFQATYTVPYSYSATTGNAATGGTGTVSTSATGPTFWFGGTTITYARQIQLGLRLTF